MTKKVLIVGLNYGTEPSIALSGRIQIAHNARDVFIAEYGILEENVVMLTDDSGPVTRDQILAAIQSLIDESDSLQEIYVYYAGYGSGINISKQIKYEEVVQPPTDDPVAELMSGNQFIPPVYDISTLTYTYSFSPIFGQYDKLVKQMLASDFEIVDSNTIITMFEKSKCRTICVLDMCPYDKDSNIMWGTDIIGNVNIISFSESDVYSSGKRAMIRVINSHFYPDA